MAQALTKAPWKGSSYRSRSTRNAAAASARLPVGPPLPWGRWVGDDDLVAGVNGRVRSPRPSARRQCRRGSPLRPPI
ncbi:hypothetical protein I552_0376 [Mycobacterium xenopi 3993]|nr:hypothetical protein I552_0376 [Mycobacterium xenopi 3993]